MKTTLIYNSKLCFKLFSQKIGFTKILPYDFSFNGERINKRFIYNCKHHTMERYTQKISILDANNRAVQQRRLNPITKPRHKFKKTIDSSDENSSKSNLHTIDVSNISDLRFKFQPEDVYIDKGTPGVGEYDISSPFFKPSYETYEKSDQVILVKINHIGGTSSFRSEGQRFIEGNSIYQTNASPGPGSYQISSQRNKKQLSTSTYHENYDLIQELLRNSRDRTQSMPNYKIGGPKVGMEYNGLPKHLQQMYLNINRGKDSVSTVKSIPLQKLIKMRKRTEMLPIMETRKFQAFPQQKRPVVDRMTETLYRLEQQLKKQQKKTQKIRAILKPSTQSKSKSIDYKTLDPYRGRNRKQSSFNKNMVNILFERTNK